MGAKVQGQLSASATTRSQVIAAQIVDGYPRLCTLAETGKVLRKSVRSVRRLIAQERLQSVRLVQAQQSRVLVPRSSIEALIAESLG